MSFSNDGFSLERTVEENRLILAPHGPLDWETCQQLREYLNHNKPRDLVIIDFTHVDAITSGGLAVLIDIHSCLKLRGAKIRIENTSDMVRTVFEIAHLSRYFGL